MMIRFALPIIIIIGLADLIINDYLILFLKQLTIIWLALQTIKKYSFKKAFQLITANPIIINIGRANRIIIN
jgi:hypothetical protein